MEIKFVKEPNFDGFKDKVDAKVGEAIKNGALEIEQLAKTRCPVDTGNLRRSIHTEIKSDKEAEIGTPVEYAPYVEFGTIYQPPQPFLIPSAEQVWNSRIKPALHNLGG